MVTVLSATPSYVCCRGLRIWVLNCRSLVGCPEFGSVEDIITVGTEALLALLAVHSSGVLLVVVAEDLVSGSGVLLVVVAEDLVSGSGSNGLRRGGLVAVLFEELDDLAQLAAMMEVQGLESSLVIVAAVGIGKEPSLQV